MKKSRKILLYGLLSSILLIILCLYLHQDGFMNEFDNDALSSDEENISIEQVLNEYKIEKNRVEEENREKNLILVDRTRIGKQITEESFTSKISTLEKNTTVVEKNVSKEDNKKEIR
ncbi:hypothetical protein KKC13_02175 [bacterium]|nr:hypothetical protein [bacterium]MBU1957683.1 hypothetical protein [bacterium]